ncbi:MAG TPA: YdeI/OmpD-associated family protein [Chloroflexota bacterium]|nr:YdeI/OmpD-associated family protein [Chloroflexota bacterium]
MDVLFFETPSEFRAWLEANHETATELWVGFHKKSTGRPSMTWPEAVDQALCFGWIDGIRKSVDEHSYTNRFTPRKPTSNWSKVNIEKVAKLTEQGLMMPAGLRAFALRDEARDRAYSFEDRPTELPPEYADRFQQHGPSWAFFQAQPPGYRRTAMHWVLSAKREETRLKRLDTLIEDSANGRRIGLLARPSKG